MRKGKRDEGVESQKGESKLLFQPSPEKPLGCSKILPLLFQSHLATHLKTSYLISVWKNVITFPVSKLSAMSASSLLSLRLLLGIMHDVCLLFQGRYARSIGTGREAAALATKSRRFSSLQMFRSLGNLLHQEVLKRAHLFGSHGWLEG